MIYRYVAMLFWDSAVEVIILYLTPVKATLVENYSIGFTGGILTLTIHLLWQVVLILDLTDLSL